jgi:chromosome segregation protein
VLPALHEWLANIFAVEDVATAYRRREELPVGGWFVTPDGHLIGQHSLVFHAPDGQLHGVLTRQREIEQLGVELIENNQIVIDFKASLLQTEQDCRAIEVQIPPLRSAIAELQRRGHTLQLQILKLTGQQERSIERGLQIAQELRDVELQLEMEQEQRQEIAMQMDLAHEEVEGFHLQLEEARHQSAVEEKLLREQRERAQQAQHALREAQFFTRSCQDKITDLQHTIALIAETLMQSEENLAQLRMDLSGSVDELAEQSLQDALHLRQLAEQALADARNELEGATASLQQAEQTRLSCEHQLNGLRERLGTLALKEQEARLYYEQWAEKLQEVDEAELVPLLASAKPAGLQNELNRLNKQIDELGAVNLAALDELNAATERKTYLDAQTQDLQQAMATLEEAIRHIDSESRDLLMDTYHKVNEQLAELFPVLFAGGEAKLVITGEEILDSGFQVMAQPPGKKNSSIHLLSGGEKALTAIALIFSLFRLNPAPFCLLDEVDAPLDDTNTERLCSLIRKMAEHTQFVFISHNKIAMEMAQQLIGVTMQEKGVSKVVSVDIEAALRMRDEVVTV